MAGTNALEVLIAPVVEAAGHALVRVAMLETPGTPTLQVMAEDPVTRQLTIDQCARLSRQISALLDEVDPIEEEYCLEVSSPGIDRPLTRARDFVDWAGHIAKVQLGAPIDGRKRFQGRLLACEDDIVQMAIEGLGTVALPLADITSAKLILTDELIKSTTPPMGIAEEKEYS